MNLREAKQEDLDEIYMMGYDVWGDNSYISDYLNECRNSTKYAKGKWYVLENESGNLLSSLLIHNLNNLNYDTNLEIRGIGSISTSPDFRRQGYGSALVEKTIEYINKNISIDIWFLYSDIDVNFYNKLNFKGLPNEFQKYSSTILMANFKDNIWNIDTNTPNIQTPDYF
ncbi:MAG: GNAT family N-acetyltransferase [Senegalia sp. (in: firmicutes)]|uniref:GNAT family N-acetyltransferase n=1 Tax=Senegalia sp. (in: firmicutes) TaxID=1924098 RepID=UPI003F946081